MSEQLATTTPRRWFEHRLCAFDLETTGVDPETARIVQACVAHVGGGAPTSSRTWLIDPGVEIPAEAAAIHGITTERARAEGMAAETAIVQISAELRAAQEADEPLVIFNAPYDLTVLDRELRRQKLGQVWPKTLNVVDPLVIDKRLDKYRKGKRQLAAMCEHYRAKLGGAHDAAFDAIAAARVAYRIGQRYGEVGSMEIGELHALQAGWYAEERTRFIQYRKNIGQPLEDTSCEWPMREWKEDGLNRG